MLPVWPLLYPTQASSSLKKDIKNMRALFDGGKHIEEQLDGALRMYRSMCCNDYIIIFALVYCCVLVYMIIW